MKREPQQPGFLQRVGQSLFRMRRRLATGAVVVAALFFGYHAIFGENGVSVYEQRRAQDAAIRKHIGELQQENAQLQQQVKALKTDPDAIEHEARERLHYARPGEVIWTEDGPASATPQDPPQPRK
jgi:cell division protein FtsB